jgi:hypothetical protein
MTKLTLTLIAALVLSSASAVLAAPKALQIVPSAPYSGTVTDEGQGRWTSVHVGGGN